MTVMNASWITVLGISLTLFFTVLYWFYILPVNQARKAALVTVLSGAVALTFVLFNGVSRLSPFGGIVILLAWSIPAFWVWFNRNKFKGLDQRKLVALQILRVIGFFFIIEMYRGSIPGSFAWPAGLGDVLVGLIALFLVLAYDKIPRSGVIVVTVLGLIDFASAFFFGFTSLPGPAQLFALGFDNQVNSFPTGMIPLFLVPYAIVNHILSIINLKEG